MHPMDYLHLLDPQHIQATGMPVLDAEHRYGDRRGITYRLDIPDGHATQEAVWIDERFLLLFGEVAPFAASAQRQIVSEGDWIHVQLQIKGGGREALDSGLSIHTHAHSCTITRYPGGTSILRENQLSAEWRAACLYLRPAMLAQMLGNSDRAFRRRWSWLFADAQARPQSVEFPLTPLELAAVGDLFYCPFRGDIRRNYMHGKAIELFSLAISHLDQGDDRRDRVALSKLDQERIAKVRHILVAEMDRQLTLTQLARRVGVNRSKLAMGFKSLYGISLQAHWRDLRLSQARELLTSQGLSVTDVAAAVGYADISCLTRAFERRFGMLPRDCKQRPALPS